jgi:exodeoxyribonuclease VII large subunit
MEPITVSALNTHILALFEQDARLRDVWVRGEVSNWKRAASGHIYFSLKDNGAAIGAVMWKALALSQSWLPAEGDQIVAHGYVGVYPERGIFQLYVNQVLPAGRGQLYEQLERLKRQLASSGLFEVARKRPIPAVPRRIGVITSRDAAALRDILRVLASRWPMVEVVLFSCLVQGPEAPGQLVAALQTANEYARHVRPLDTLILARGGGSIEDLWAFNNEQLAYAIAQSELPVITGVGHETDYTIADFVADLRMPTPSAAAAAAVPDRAEVREQLMAIQQRLLDEASERLLDARDQLIEAQLRLQRLNPRRQLDLRRQRLEDRTVRLNFALRRRLDRLADGVKTARLRLAALDPVAVLGRGYSIVQRADGQVVTHPGQIKRGERLQVQAAGGAYAVTPITTAVDDERE